MDEDGDILVRPNAKMKKGQELTATKLNVKNAVLSGTRNVKMGTKMMDAIFVLLIPTAKIWG